MFSIRRLFTLKVEGAVVTTMLKWNLRGDVHIMDEVTNDHVYIVQNGKVLRKGEEE